MNTKLLIAFISIIAFNFDGFNNGKKSQSGSNELAEVVNFDTLIFQLYNDYIPAGEIYTIEVFSPNFKDILGFQFAFKMEDIDFLEIVPGSVPTNIGNYNWIKDKGQLLVSFSDGDFYSSESDEILFSIKIIPKVNTYVKDLVSIADDILSSEAIYLTFNSSSILLEFQFLERLSSNIQIVDLPSVRVIPNQLAIGKNQVSVTGMEMKEASLYSFNGKYISNEKNIQNNTLVLDFQSSGMYILKVFDGKMYHNEILTVN